MQSSVKLKESTVINESVRDRVRSSTRQTEKSSVENNPIFQIMLSGNATHSERKKEFAEFMTATLDRETDRARIKMYEEFREWLASQNTALAQQIIELTNTNTFASLQKIIEDMNNGLIAFEDELSPLMDIVNSIYQLRTSGVMYDAFREIESDRIADKNRQEELETISKEVDKNKKYIKDLELENASLSEKRGLFGFGNITEEARRKIAENEMLISKTALEISEKENKQAAMSTEVLEKKSKLGDMAIHKEKLRDLLDLSSTENSERMVKLRDSALAFVEHSKNSTSTIRGEFGTLSSQLDNAEDNNRKMTSIYGIMTEGMKDASKNNIAKRSELQSTLDNSPDDIIIKMQSEDGLRNLDSHSKMLHAAQGETLNTYAELSQQAIRVGSMKEATQQQVDIARKLNTQGVSATADRLASVMTAVSGAAIGESAGVVEMTLERMRNKTNEITQQEVIRNAMYVDKINNEMEKVFSELETFRDTQRASSDIVREGLSIMTENMSALLEQTNHLKNEIREAASLHSEFSYTGENDKKTPQKQKQDNSFKF